jgi:hypothetical protein
MNAHVHALRRAHRETAAVFLAAGLAAYLVATRLSWNADVLVSVAVGTLAGAVAMIVLAGRGTGMPVAATGTVRTAVASATLGVAVTLGASLALGGDGWGVLAVVLLAFGAAHLWTAAVRPSAA